ncbi:MAG: TonB-dependent receptor [Cyclobacteriaceae bacterium]|nr:TonB-dependent receptor [Cyclobacteriaceae bacterium HetDA_MAG_MS6]
MRDWKMNRIIFATMTLLSVFKLACQDQPPLQFDFRNTPLLQAIGTLEEQGICNFYFQDHWISDYTITGQARTETLADLISTLLSSTDLHFVLIGQKVILTPTPIIQTLEVGTDIPDESQNPILDQRMINRERVEVLQIGDKDENETVGPVVLSGIVRSAESNQPIVGALVSIDRKFSTTTDPQGGYRLEVPRGFHELIVQFAGMKLRSQRIEILADGELHIEMNEEAIQLEDIMISATEDENISDVRMGIATLDMEQLKNVPKVLGENDIVQVALALPGVQNVGEGASGLNVRGGKTDQNLMLFNNATVYNPFHFFGFFSAFNADVIGTSELYKSSIPASYGGRLSSLLDVKLKKGNVQKFSGKGGISPVTGQLSLEVPLIKEKMSIISGIRGTYSDWLLNQVKDETIKNSDPSFFDVATGIHLDYGNGNTVYASIYHSRDRFKVTTDSLYSYQNLAASLGWRHAISKRLLLQTTLTTSQYAFDIDYDVVAEEAFSYGFEVKETYGQLALNYFLNQHELQVGFDSKLYDVLPGFFRPTGGDSQVLEEEIERERGLESSFFVSDDYAISSKLTLYTGLRFSFFSALGGRSANFYEPGQPRSEDSFTETISFPDHKTIQKYSGPEVRLSLKYSTSAYASIKASYSKSRQYIHALSNNVSISPTDTWKLSDHNFKPQLSDQFSIGYFQNLKDNEIEASIEAYYKTFDNLLDYEVGADLILNPNLETDVIQGEGFAYGAELLIKKKKGKLNGWMSYTYSRSQQSFDSQFVEETINGGAHFPTNFEKPHDISIVANYKHTRRFSFSMNINYSTGRPITYPTAKYELSGTEIVHFSDRNSFRLPDYFRIDLSVNIEGSHRVKKLGHSYWSFSIYNLTARKNVYSIFFANNGGDIEGYELSVLGTAIPSITYNFKF